MENSLEVYKSNSLVEASYRLTPAEQCIILSCISQIRKDEKITDETMYKVSVWDYINLTGADRGTAYRDMRDAAERLDGRRVRIYELPNGEGRVKNKGRMLKVGWVQTIAYSDGCGEVELRFNRDMLPYLTNISNNFTTYNLKDVAKMSSSFGIRLYELLVEWKDKYKTTEQEISVEQLRKLLQITGSYAAIKDLKKRVLEPAIADVNAHSNIQVSWEQKKTGRRVSHLKFIFKLKKDKSKPKKKEQLNLSGSRVLGIDKAIIEKNARLGETYQQAAIRIINEGKKEPA